ncbi:MAG: hypothetical protein JWN61_898 [Pseudonocardiales bacterium]|nr:hypothetical protein [Pseudonocardiales bacterium]
MTITMPALDEPTVASAAAIPGPAAVPVALPAGHLLSGRYRIEAAIGLGGMAVVYRARDTALRRPVAIKVFGPSGDDLDLLGVDDAATRIDREIRTHAGLRHTGLVQLFDAVLPDSPAPSGAPDPTPWGYLVLELASGGTLSQRQRQPAAPGVDVRALALDMADALAYLHGRGIAHCDMKPSNIVFDRDGRAKIIDLGIAVDAASPRPQVPSGWLAGTARYASPEQLRGLALTTATDIYSLGLVLLDLLGGGRATSASPLPMVDVVPVDVPISLGSQWFWLLTSMLCADPAQRPTAAAVRRMVPVR